MRSLGGAAKCALAAIAIAGATLATPRTAQAATNVQKCEAAFEAAAGEFVSCHLTAEQKFTLTGDALKRSEGLMKCSDMLQATHTKAVDRFGAHNCTSATTEDFHRYLSQCSTHASKAAAIGGALPDPVCQAPPAQILKTGQTTCWDVAGRVINCARTGHDGELQQGIARAYTDNGDGTVTDTATGLMWEKLSDDGSIHDKDNVYVWNYAFTMKVATLNSESFAGHSDWRVPNSFELYSLVNLGNAFPAISAAFNTNCGANSSGNPGCTVTTCSCTVSNYYWSSSTNVIGPHQQWSVLFFDGSVSASNQSSTHYVRAVRGGRVELRR